VEAVVENKTINGKANLEVFSSTLQELAENDKDIMPRDSFINLKSRRKRMCKYADPHLIDMSGQRS